jgi:hypothetical protein
MRGHPIEQDGGLTIEDTAMLLYGIRVRGVMGDAFAHAFPTRSDSRVGNDPVATPSGQ